MRVWSAVPDVLWRRTSASTVLRCRDEMLVLDVPGAAVWEALQQGGTSQELASVVARRFGLGPADVVDDLEVLLHELVRQGVAQEEDAG